MRDVCVSECLALTAHHVMFPAKTEQIRFATQMWLTARRSKTLHQTTA